MCEAAFKHRVLKMDLSALAYGQTLKIINAILSAQLETTASASMQGAWV